VDKDRADLELKKLTLDRTRQLAREKLVSQSDVDTARSNDDQAVAQIALDQAAVQQAEAGLEEARVSLAYTDIVSPVDGVVVSRNVSVGQTVAASFQTPTLFLIAEDLTKMQVDANVSESDIGEVKEGQRASFTVDAFPGREFTGSVAQVRNAPISVQNVVTYDVVVAVDNADLALKPGMTATTGVTTAERQNVLRIPTRALRFHPAGASAEEAARAADAHPAVWSLDERGELRRVEIETGARNDSWVEVRSGLREGDRVIVAARASARPSATPAGPPGFGGGPGYRHR
jgi:HlyD family secretion protein